ncbi:MAG: transglycosylase SLT domain-containing protein [Actinomycetota bacterium]
MRTRLLLAGLLVAGACSPVQIIDGGGETRVAETPSPSPSPSVSPTPDPDEPKPFAPGPGKRLPRRPALLADKLGKVDDALEESIPAWKRSGAARPPQVVVLQALYHQRILRLMASKRSLGNKTMRRLDGPLARSARKIVGAQRELGGLVTPLPANFTFKTGRSKPARELLGYYRKAQRRFDVDRHVLAAVNYVESKFGKVKATSSAGARGPMQFLPSTWGQYGMGGDIKDDRDAIMGAANYLRASGASERGGLRRALFAYNRSNDYVRAVIAYSRYLESRRRHYFTIYNWQVYVVTVRGDKRLTGPGL